MLDPPRIVLSSQRTKLHFQELKQYQEPMSNNTATLSSCREDLFLDRIFLEWDSRGSAMTNHKKLNDVTWSLAGTALLSQKKRYTKNKSCSL